MSNDYGLSSVGIPNACFQCTPSDDEVLRDPDTNEKIIGVSITVTESGNVNVLYQKNNVPVIIPMIAGVRRSCLITKIYETDTDATGILVEYNK